MIWGSIISKGAFGEASTIISFSRPSLTYLFSRPTCAAKSFWCDVGTDFPRDPGLASEIERTLDFLRNEIQASL
jgi:hypothetical protein